MNMKIIQLYEMPEPFGSPELELIGIDTLRFRYNRDQQPRQAALRFGGVVALQVRADTCIEKWQNDLYYILSEAVGSAWWESVVAAAPERLSYRTYKHHYAILDVNCCYEFIADSWELLPEEEG